MRKRKSPRIWTREEEGILKNEYPTTSTKELAKRLNVSQELLRSKAKRMSVKKDAWTHGRQPWTRDHKEMMTKYFAITKSSDLAKKMNRSVNSVNSQAIVMGISKDEDYLKEVAIQRDLDLTKRGEKTRFKKGRVSNRKGVKLTPEQFAKMKPNMFKKGHKTHNTKPIGYSRITADGYIEVKVEQPKRFELLHRFMWKVWKGPIPEDHIITFKDGNQKNCNIENLICISKADNMNRNNINRYPTDLRDTMWQIGRLKSKIKKITNQ
ncbi:HNH endonuclease signature motif containing protein [Brumimicrobium mesophilum]|uniref:HNH endonuclease signature motif containing protein n=1 Tax=Brumimicrobium mesophilum TaxID=392717 RepID=UPI000D143871|nr:HNH endonuclease signature motif containing protein [Brumimicrobium mesophilum]